MYKCCFLCLGLLINSASHGQGFALPQWDIPLLESQIAHNKEEYKKHTTLRNNQLASSATQTLAKEEGKKFEDKVRVLHARLTNLSSLLSDGKMVLEASHITADILKYQAQILKLVYQDPKVSAIAVFSQAHLVKKSALLVKYVGLLVIAAGDLNAMKAIDRRQVLKHILDDLRVIRGQAYGLTLTLRWAKMGDRYRSLNPWATYINQDKQLADNILKSIKF